MHGYGIALSIKRLSDDVLTVEEGSLYPALQRLLVQGWVKGEWKITETGRRARYYTLTAAGRKQLDLELSQFEQMITAIGRVLRDPRRRNHVGQIVEKVDTSIRPRPVPVRAR